MGNFLIGALGGLTGSIILAVVKNYLDKTKAQQLRYKELMEEKYRYILIIMACILNYDNRKLFSLNEQTTPESSETYLLMLKQYYYHNFLYSDDKIILTIKNFIEAPCLENFIKSASSMRKNLWGKKTRLKYENITLKILDNQ